ncbi:hybrid sensor histidine kinase/response regulator [Salidesulfovibrio onnuriiensis]|uniref:hybrid sensor histidine kinase/response regulator n=1 Tax=Salidesulfovibrio onnuriiensis TaxID=2583823 RepID=UPI00202AD896|nr:response regulator [Salidesulfovibrio onnuriiensis]
MAADPPQVFRVLAVDPDMEMLTSYRDVLCFEGEEPSALEALFDPLRSVPSNEEVAREPDQAAFEVSLHQDGRAALREAAHAIGRGGSFAVALVEMAQAGDLSGVEVAERLRGIDPNVEIVMMAASSGIPLKELNKRIPPPDKLLYIQKPFRSQELRQLANSLCHKWHAELQLKEFNERLSQIVDNRTQELNKVNRRLMRDISKRASVLKQLKASEKRYRLLFDKDITGNFAADGNGLILDCNEAFAAIFGFSSPQEAKGIDIHDLWETFQGEGDLREKLARGVRIKNYELEHRGRGGRILLLANVDAVRSQEGDLEEIRGYFFDITERKELEEQLRLAQKMEALGTLAGGIAHDFNNILGVIMGYAEIIQSGADTGSGLERRAGEILLAGGRARDLVTQILNFSRQGPQERQPMNLAPLVKEALKLLRSSIPTNIEIDVRILARDDRIMADATQVHQVLMNLCTNAAHAMREHGGRMAVEIADADDSDRACIPEELGRPEWFVRLTVRDTGHGIEPDLLDRIFDPFFTTKGLGEGTGMGLSMVHGIATRHEGHVHVESEPGNGAVFHVYLPRTPSLVKPEMASPPPLVFTRGRILFVDDEKPLVDVGREMLEGFGFEVVTRTSSIEALEAFRHRADDFDLVITDQAMPNMTGMELSREILKIRADQPIILCTGFSEAVSYERIREAGIGDFIMKPILKHELMQSMGRLLGGGDGDSDLIG